MNSVIDKLQEKDSLSKGTIFLLSNSLIKLNVDSIQKLIEDIDNDKIDITKIELSDKEKIKIVAKDLIKDGVSKIIDKKEKEKI